MHHLFIICINTNVIKCEFLENVNLERTNTYFNFLNMTHLNNVILNSTSYEIAEKLH